MDAQDDIAERVKRYFTRQIAWLETQRDALAALPAEPTDEALDAAVAQQAKRARESEEFAREQRGLLREWQAAAVNPDAKAEIQNLAARAEALSAELSVAYDAAAARIGDDSKAPKGSLDSMRRSRQVLDSYRPTDPGGSDFLDRRA